jgi:hypothetical protein
MSRGARIAALTIGYGRGVTDRISAAPLFPARSAAVVPIRRPQKDERCEMLGFEVAR